MIVADYSHNSIEWNFTIYTF